MFVSLACRLYCSFSKAVASLTSLEVCFAVLDADLPKLLICCCSPVSVLLTLASSIFVRSRSTPRPRLASFRLTSSMVWITPLESSFSVPSYFVSPAIPFTSFIINHFWSAKEWQRIAHFLTPCQIDHSAAGFHIRRCLFICVKNFFLRFLLQKCAFHINQLFNQFLRFRVVCIGVSL